MLTVIGPKVPDNWMDILCRCDCGSEITLGYQQLYYKRYSCGCKRRLRANCIDYTGWQVYGKRSNQGDGRTLTVLCQDPDDGLWIYICDCCGETSKVPRGVQRGLDSTLKDIVSRECPNYLPFVPVEQLAKICNLVGDQRVMGSQAKAEAIAAEFYPPDRVKRNIITDEIEGFRGYPKEPAGGFPRVNAEIARLRRSARMNLEKYRPVGEDPDGFG